jgi:tetratricopeptide (TPR) repeat protein
MTRRLTNLNPSNLVTMFSRAALLAGLMAILAIPAFGQVGRSGIQVTAVDEQGQPRAGLEVILRPVGETAGREQVVKTDRRGRFANRFLASGSYVVEVRDKDNFFIKEAKVDIMDASGILLQEYEIIVHPIRGLDPIPIHGGQVTHVALVVTDAEYGRRLRRQVEGGAVSNELQQLVNLYNEGRHEEALALGHRLMDATESELPEVIHLVGMTYARLDRFSEAEPMLRRAVELEPEQHELKAGLGTMLLEMARTKERREEDARAEYTEAEKWLGRAVSAMEKPPLALLVNHSIALEGAGQPEAAIEVMERIASEDPENLPVRFRMAALLRTMGQPERALEVLNNLPGGGDPRAVNTLYNIALTFYNEDDYTSAIAALRRAVELDPDEALVQRLMGRTLYAMGQPREAIPHLERFIELAPDHPEVELEREMVRFLQQTTRGQ